MNVQSVVRSMPWVKWQKGISKCYTDTSYSKTEKRIRFKFDRCVVYVHDCETQEAELIKALTEAGHKAVMVQVLRNYISVWQEFSICNREM